MTVTPNPPHLQFVWSLLNNALTRYHERVGVVLPDPVGFEVVESDAFFAHVYPVGDGYGLEVSNGVVAHISDAWARALELSESMPKGYQIELMGNPGHPAEMSLRWLTQHELNHFAIGHFHVMGAAGLLEGNRDAAMGIAARRVVNDNNHPNPLIHGLSPEEQLMVPLCLELQTDHDATEIVLGAYSAENWVLFRYYAICILMVIMIIEREERAQISGPRNHPQAATRLFMLLGHLIQMPVIPGAMRAREAGLAVAPETDRPSDEEFDGYRDAVILPVLTASQLIAEAVGLPAFWDELGGMDAMFRDIERAVHDGTETVDAFETTGAKEWASLKPLNDRLLAMLAPYVRA